MRLRRGSYQLQKGLFPTAKEPKWDSLKQIFHPNLFLYNTAMLTVRHTIRGNHRKMKSARLICSTCYQHTSSKATPCQAFMIPEDMLSLANAASCTLASTFLLVTVIPLIQLRNFLFSSYYHSLKTYYILPKKYQNIVCGKI